MGLSYRSSSKIGPFRLTHSVSTRGAYISVSSCGFTYRIPLAEKKTQRRPSPPAPVKLVDAQPEIFEIESADTDQLTDVSSKKIIEKITNPGNRFRIWPFVLFSIVGLLALHIYQIYPLEYLVIAGTILTLATILIESYLINRKYKLTYADDESTQAICRLVNELVLLLPKCEYVWHIEGYVKTSGTKLQRSPIRIGKTDPDFVDTNVEVCCLPVGKQRLYFFPDRLYITERHRVAAIDYGELEVEVRRVDMTEKEILPDDAPLISRSWEHVRLDGEPDRRYRDNPRIYTFEYGAIHFKSSTGLNELIMVSNPAIAEKFKNIFDQWVAKIKALENKGECESA